MMKTNKRISIFILVTALLAVTIIAFATIKSRHVAVVEKKINPADTFFKKHVYDQKLLKRLEVLCQKYDTIKTKYTIEGTINILDKADTSVKVREVNFVYCKKGNDFYYQMGNGEVINSHGLYIAIDHQNHSLVVSKQKQIQDPQSSQMLNGIAAALRSEAYDLVSKRTGGQQTLSLINEHHVSCKQYSISFDTVNLNISRIYSRVSNVYEPLRKDKEKIVDLKIGKWDGSADLDRYETTKNVVVATGEQKWKGTGKYAGYQIIKM